MAHSHGYCELAVLWLRLLCDAGCRPERPRWGRPGLRPATLATASWDVLAYGQPPHGATFLGGSLHRGSVLCTPPPALALISPLENVKTTNFQYFRQIYFVDIQ